MLPAVVGVPVYLIEVQALYTYMGEGQGENSPCLCVRYSFPFCYGREEHGLGSETITVRQ